MSTNKHIDRICCAAVILALLVTAIFMNSEAFGITASAKTIGYENRLFDTSKVHTIDIVMDDWDGFLETCQSEEYSMCSIIIDGETYKNVGIRGKGNTSLSSVAAMDSDRYSFKVEFDQYDSSKSYHGLDKLCLNNIIQDNTYMKDYLVYQMMNDFGVDSPLCSYAYITVNGEDWGLYIAVEGVEDGFLQRNYGADSGELYKPDSMSFGGGRGNGKDFNMEDFDFNSFDPTSVDASDIPQMPQDFNPGSDDSNDTPQMPQDFNPGSDDSNVASQIPQDFNPDSDESNVAPQITQDSNPGSDESNNAPQIPQDFNPSSDDSNVASQIPQDFNPSPDESNNAPQIPQDFGGMGNSDVKLQYIDDEPNSYSNIFDNAKTDITDKDKERLIASLKSLSNYENLEEVVNIEEVIRYFVVHNFVVNGDSYTGSMIHNYYLYEENGQLSMIPWDYNLAFGTFQASDANNAVNDSIDFSDGSMQDRPMLNWIFEDEEYTALYYQYFDEFITNYFDSGYYTEMIDSVIEMISPYVEKDPTKFCTYEEFEVGTQTLKTFCELRAESVRLQIEGSDDTVDASAISLSDMGTMNNGKMGNGFGGNIGNNFDNNFNDNFNDNFDGSFDDNFDDNVSHETSSDNVTDTTAASANTQDTISPAADTQSTTISPTNDPNASANPSDESDIKNSRHHQQFAPQNMSGFTNSTANVENNQDTFILLGVCGIVLLAGLLFAWKYRR